MSKGKDRIDLNAPEFVSLKEAMERRGEPIPADGVLLKEAYLAYVRKRYDEMAASVSPTYYFKRVKR